MSGVNPVVSTRSGRLMGRADAHARVFLDVPYAAPPVAGSRFAAPRPHQPWTGIRDSTRLGPNAPQPARGRMGSLAISPFFAEGWSPGEDYLTMNLWAPREQAGPAPVVLFVHGGAFIAGSTRGPIYDGTAFARDGLVFVTVNYRLGAPGFLHLPDAPDNRGRLDVIAALAWLRDNVEAFGGDPQNVTLAGQSAGAIIVSSIVGAPDGRGLFRRAISQSGSGTAAFTPEQAGIVTERFGREIGSTPSAASLARVSDDELVATASRLAGVSLATAAAHDPLGGITPFAPVLAIQPADRIASGHGPQIDLLIGSNSDESSLYLAPFDGLAGTTDDDVRATAARFHRDPDRLLAAYRNAMPDVTPAEFRVAILGDGMFGAGTRRVADAHSRHGGGATYVYEFGWQSNALDGALKSSHLMELPFVFEQTGLSSLIGPNALLGSEPPPRALATRMHAAWVSFARHGNPGWPAYTVTEPAVELIASSGRSAIGWKADVYRAWNE